MATEDQSSSTGEQQLEIFSIEEVRQAGLRRVSVACLNELRSNQLEIATRLAGENGIELVEAEHGTLCQFAENGLPPCASEAIRLTGIGVAASSPNGSAITSCPLREWARA